MKIILFKLLHIRDETYGENETIMGNFVPLSVLMFEDKGKLNIHVNIVAKVRQL